eukprot:jgi/Chrzof1/12292/Cz06g29040.t1_P19-1
MVLLTAPCLTFSIAGLLTPAQSATQGFKTFLGYSLQPDLYMGYGASINNEPLYTFEYPASWEEMIPTKTEKSTMGMDGRVVNPTKKGKENAFVIALGGKDYADARLTDLKSTLVAMAGSDPDLREVVSNAIQINQEVKKVAGRDVYMYDILSDRYRYLSTVSIKDGTVFGLFIKAPPQTFIADEDDLRHIQKSFQLL